MASCEYYLLQDLYESIDAKLGTIAQKMDDNSINVEIDKLDIDLDNLEAQLIIANKLKLLDAIGVDDIMTEQEQAAAYTEIKEALFGSVESSESSEPAEPKEPVGDGN